MITRTTRSLLVLVALLLFVGVTSINASPGQCSLATLKGSYGFLEQGTLLQAVSGLPLPPPLPYANVGIAILDGAGHASGTYTGSFGGVIVSGPFSGTYTVSPDCTYSLVFTPSPFPETLHHFGTISGDGMVQEIHYIYTDPNLNASGLGKKTPNGQCSAETFKGSYTVSGQGTDVFAPLPGLSPPFPMAHVAIITADGKGHIFGAGTEHPGGISFPDTVTGTYTVSPDCNVSVMIADTGGGSTVNIPEVGVITGQGQSQELRSIIAVIAPAPVPIGLVFADTIKPQ